MGGDRKKVKRIQGFPYQRIWSIEGRYDAEAVEAG